MKISIIIPCYNEEKNISKLVEKFRELLEIKKNMDLELILVNNGSGDNTGHEIELFAEKNKFIKPVVVEVNQGYGYGILAGLSVASGNWLGWMHADLQSDPLVFGKMFDSAQTEKSSFLYKGSRKKRPLVDTIFTIGMSLFETLYLGVCLWDINAQPTLMDRAYYETWKEPPYDFSLDLFVYYMAKKMKVKVKRFKSKQYKRENGISSWNNGMKARFILIKRVVLYSRKMKNSCH